MFKRRLMALGIATNIICAGASSVTAMASEDKKLEVSGGSISASILLEPVQDCIESTLDYIKEANEHEKRIRAKIETNKELNDQIEAKRIEEQRRKEVEEEAKHWREDTFRITAYCNCEICNGKWAWGKTASGVMPVEGRTIAVDPNIIPLGSKVIIDGNTYIAEDTGSAIIGNRIDLYIDSHQRADDHGVKYKTVKYRVD